jgi:putative membrane protein
MNQDNQTPKEGQDKTSSPAPATPYGNKVAREPRIMKLISSFSSALSLGKGKTEKQMVQADDLSTQLAHRRTDLAMDRNYLAAERTLMGWIRTALSMISFGFTIGKLGQVMSSVEVKGFLGKTKMMSVESIAYFLVILGTVALLAAAFQHWQRVRELYDMGLSRKLSITFYVAIVLTVVGGFALSSLVMSL